MLPKAALLKMIISALGRKPVTLTAHGGRFAMTFLMTTARKKKEEGHE
ncbi:MAG: hypothetical protein AABX69_05245 [Nanoarchaeota archaeon]